MSESIEPDAQQAAKRAIEAIVLVSDEPISSQLLAQLLELPATVVDKLVAELAGEYDAEHRGFELVGVAGGWRYQTRPDMYDYVERFAMAGINNKLSKAALETLSIVAYKQPISRSQIAAIRGVNADGVLKTLEHRGYVVEAGRDDGPGQAMLFGTTPFFLERLGLNAVDELPPLGDFVPSAEVLEILEESLRIEDEPVDVADDTESVNDTESANLEQSADPELVDEESVDTESLDTEPVDEGSLDVQPSATNLPESQPADLDLTTEELLVPTSSELEPTDVSREVAPDRSDASSLET